jgi:hypothetical protein
VGMNVYTYPAVAERQIEQNIFLPMETFNLLSLSPVIQQSAFTDDRHDTDTGHALELPNILPKRIFTCDV